MKKTQKLMIMAAALVMLLGGCNLQLMKPATNPFYDVVLERNPKNPAALYGQGEFLLRQGRNQEAETHFRRFVRVEPEQAKGWIALGRSQFDQHNFTAARESFRKAIDLGPNPVAYFGWATATLMAGDPTEAQTISQTIEQKFGPSAELTRLHGDIAYINRNFDQALKYYQESLQQAPGQRDLQERVRDLQEYLTAPPQIQ